MRLFGQIQAFSFFYETILNAQKLDSNQNQLTKQKQANKKQQIEQVFPYQKNIWEDESRLFCVLVFFYAQSHFVKK